MEEKSQLPTIKLRFSLETIKLSKPFWYHSMCYSITHIVSKFQLIIPIFSVAKLKNKTLKSKKGGKKSITSN